MTEERERERCGKSAGKVAAAVVGYRYDARDFDGAGS